MVILDIDMGLLVTLQDTRFLTGFAAEGGHLDVLQLARERGCSVPVYPHTFAASSSLTSSS